jgi:multiple sugar transport system substrate-binding protein
MENNNSSDDPKPKPSGISRREFIKFGAAGAAAVAGIAGSHISTWGLNRARAQAQPTLLSYTQQPQMYNGQPIKLTVWSYKAAFEELFNKYFKQYTDMYPNVEFEQTVLPFADTLKKLQAAIPANQAPDMFYMFWLWQPPIVNAQLIRPMPEDRFPQSVLEASFSNVRATYGGADGKAYWLPLGVLTGGLFINDKMWEKAGLKAADVPTTWDKMIEIAKQLTVRDSQDRIQVAGYNPTGYIQSTWRPMYYQQGKWFFNEDYTRHHFDVPEVRRVLQFFDDVYKVHKVSATDFLRFDESFGTEKAAMIYMWTNVLPNIRKYPELSFSVHRIPTWTGELTPAAAHGTLDPQSLVVPVSTPDDRAAVCWDVINFLYANKEFLVETALNQASAPTGAAIKDDPRITGDPIISALLPQSDYIVQTMGMPQAASDAGTKYANEAPFVAGMPIDQALKEGQAAIDKAMSSGGPFYVKEREYKYADLMKFQGQA